MARDLTGRNDRVEAGLVQRRVSPEERNEDRSGAIMLRTTDKYSRSDVSQVRLGSSGDEYSDKRQGRDKHVCCKSWYLTCKDCGEKRGSGREEGEWLDGKSEQS